MSRYVSGNLFRSYQKACRHLFNSGQLDSWEIRFTYMVALTFVKMICRPHRMKFGSLTSKIENGGVFKLVGNHQGLGLGTPCLRGKEICISGAE
jgi:hypothetical protein